MAVFIKELSLEIQKLLQGNLNFGHYFTLGFGLISLIVGIFSLKDRIIKGVFVIISSLYYTFCFCITFNNYATNKSVLIFSISAVIINFLIWLIVSRIKIKHCFKCLWTYLLALIPAGIGDFVSSYSKVFNFSENVILQFCFLFTSVILSFSVPYFANLSPSKSSPDPFEELGPGWKDVFRKW